MAAAEAAAAPAASSGDSLAPEAQQEPADFEDRTLTRREEVSLLHPLLRLRQACCHPQVGGSGIKAVAHQRAPMTMFEVLELMVGKARVEAEDAQVRPLTFLHRDAVQWIIMGVHRADLCNPNLAPRGAYCLLLL